MLVVMEWISGVGMSPSCLSLLLQALTPLFSESDPAQANLINLTINKCMITNSIWYFDNLSWVWSIDNHVLYYRIYRCFFFFLTSTYIRLQWWNDLRNPVFLSHSLTLTLKYYVLYQPKVYKLPTWCPVSLWAAIFSEPLAACFCAFIYAWGWLHT